MINTLFLLADQNHVGVTLTLLDAGYIIPQNLPVCILLPNSPGLFWWDAMIRWLAVAFFIQIPIDIAYNMQQRLPYWYYITIQVNLHPCLPHLSQTFCCAVCATSYMETADILSYSTPVLYYCTLYECLVGTWQSAGTPINCYYCYETQ